MEQPGLPFPKLVTAVTLSPERAEPWVWVRRLVIWKNSSEIVRDILFRKGVNIVWSPNGGDGDAKLGENVEIGHGAGKSLLCRLLRYCLGEETFANEVMEKKIALRFKEGFVGAEVMVDGKLWSIIRPIGIRRKHMVSDQHALEELLIADLPGTGMAPFFKAIENHLAATWLPATDIGKDIQTSWLHCLAWLSRDQECRFDHLFSWRDTKTQSKSPALGLTREETGVAARFLLGLINRAEEEERQRNTGLLQSKKALERTREHLAFLKTRLQGELSRNGVGSDEDFTVIGLAGIKRTLEETLHSGDNSTLLRNHETRQGELEKQLEAFVSDVAVVQKQCEELISLRDLQKERLSAILGERATLDAEEIKRRLGPVCPVCNVPIDESLAHGCGISSVQWDPGQVVVQKADKAQEDRSCRNWIRYYEQRLTETKTIFDQKDQALSKVRAEIQAILILIQQQQQQDEQKRSNIRMQLESIARLEQSIQEIEETKSRLVETERQIDISLKSQDEYRKEHAALVMRFAELYDYVVKGLAGSHAHGEIRFSGRDIAANVELSGDINTVAMESFKVLAFDIAALLFSLEGKSFLPGLLIHDSPREADLGLSLYHRLFRFMAELEGGLAAPPFQYIITTTTEPPADLSKLPYLVVSLQGATTNERLLRQDL